MAKVSRSQFVEKLFDLLSASAHPEDLRWVSADAFEITADEKRARAALAPAWDFRSLSSFIRQLSYYNFKRLSDRRRSVERKSGVAAFIVFSHPSGNFNRDDRCLLENITRKVRARKASRSSVEYSRRASFADATSSPEAEQSHDGDVFPRQWVSYSTHHDSHGRTKPDLQLSLPSLTAPDWNAQAATYPSPLYSPCHVPQSNGYPHDASSYFHAVQQQQHFFQSQSAQPHHNGYFRPTGAAIIAPPSPPESRYCGRSTTSPYEEDAPPFRTNQTPQFYHQPQARRNSAIPSFLTFAPEERNERYRDETY